MLTITYVVLGHESGVENHALPGVLNVVTDARLMECPEQNQHLVRVRLDGIARWVITAKPEKFWVKKTPLKYLLQPPTFGVLKDSHTCSERINK